MKKSFVFLIIYICLNAILSKFFYFIKFILDVSLYYKNYFLKGVSAKNGCNKGSECTPGHCCISINQPRGKRGISSAKKMGYCSKLPKLNQNCLYNENSNEINYMNGMVYQCPCVDGFKCVSTGLRIIPIGYAGKCQPNKKSN